MKLIYKQRIDVKYFFKSKSFHVSVGERFGVFNMLGNIFLYYKVVFKELFSKLKRHQFYNSVKQEIF